MTDKLLIEAREVADWLEREAHACEHSAKETAMDHPQAMQSLLGARAAMLKRFAASVRGLAHRSQQEAAQEPVESDFTDTGRAALLWVLWHHQGGSSPVGQPIRFALGMGADERLGDTRIEEAKRWAALAGWSTEKVHKYHPPASTATSESEARDLSKIPVYAWASNRQPKAIHHQVKDLWLKVRAEQVEDYTEPLVLLADVRAALSASGQKGEPT